jgi:hypothetical protein
VFVLGGLRALRLRRLSGVRVFAAAVAGSAFVDGAQRCAFHLAARQVRIHHATDTDFYLVRAGGSAGGTHPAARHCTHQNRRESIAVPSRRARAHHARALF